MITLKQKVYVSRISAITTVADITTTSVVAVTRGSGITIFAGPEITTVYCSYNRSTVISMVIGCAITARYHVELVVGKFFILL